MNNIKTYIIGFLSCACLLLIMGYTSYNQGEILCNSITLVDKDNNQVKIDKDWGERPEFFRSLGLKYDV